MFQPGKARGVRWTIHHTASHDGGDVTLALTSPVFQLLVGARLRSIHVRRYNPMHLEGYRVHMHSNRFFYVADGIVEFTTVEVEQDSQRERETQVLFPTHGMILPTGVAYSLRSLAHSVVVECGDEDEPSPFLTFPDS